MRPSFADCIVACLESADYCAEWARLRGVTLPKDPKDGREQKRVADLFLQDVYELVYLRAGDERA